MINVPGYYNRYMTQTPQPKWQAVEFKPGVPPQSAEWNEAQSILGQRIQALADSLYKNGAWILGGQISSAASGNDYLVSIVAGRLYAYGYFHDVPASSIAITGSGTETISLIISIDIQTIVQDPTLSDPVVGAEAYLKPGADRLEFDYSYELNTANGILVATFIDGQLQTAPTSNTFLDQILALLAQRTYETSGAFIAIAPSLFISDIAVSTTNPAQLLLTIKSGVGYPKGVRVQNTNTLLPITRPVTGQGRVDEPHTFISGTKVYTMSNPPVLSFDSIQATIQPAAFTMTRGGTIHGLDAIPSQYQPVLDIVSIAGYTQGTDFVLSGNYVSWIGSAPTGGTSYTITLQQTKVLTKAIRVQTGISGESHASIASSGTTSLGHSDIDLTSPFVMTNTTTSTTLTIGTDFTVASNTGVLTWINRPTGQNITVTYSYWAHSVEGDYIVRDSFQDSAGNVLYASSPSLTPSGTAIDYSVQIAFDTTSGVGPTASSTPLFSYQYALGRVDTLAWKKDGTLWVFPGVPGLNPTSPGCDSDYVPIADISLPPLCTASGTTIQPYNNVTMYETDLRTMQKQVLNILYDLAQVQLTQNTSNLPAATDKIGIFADPLSTPFLANVTAPGFGGTFDFPAGTFSLPRTMGTATPAVNSGSSVNAILKDDMWMVAYTPIVGVSQGYASQASVINLYGQVNQRAKILLNPSADVEVNSSVTINGVTTNAVESLNTSSVTNPLLLANFAVNNTALAGIVIPPGYTGEEVSADTDIQDYAVNNGKYYAVDDDLSWDDIISNTTVALNTTPLSKTITITGSGFRSNDRAISLTLDGVPLPLTPIAPTVADSNTSLYSGTVIANASGAFKASFVVPAGITTGGHTVQVVSHTFADITAVSSYATAIYSATAYLQELDVNVTTFLYEYNQGMVPTCYMPLYALTGLLNLGPPTAAMLATVNGPMAYTIATVISEANRLGLQANLTTIITDGVYYISALDYYLGFLYAATTYYLLRGPFPGFDYAPYGTAITHNPANVDLTSTNISANAQILINQGESYFDVSLCSIATGATDPLAETFTLSQDSLVDSIDLYFAVAPTTEVGVALALSSNGTPTKTYLGTTWLQPSSITVDPVHGTAKTTFQFSKPIFVNGGVEYAFIVMTQDSNASIWTASLGKTDVNGNGLIAKNPSSGTLLQSPNASTWSQLIGEDLKFNINVANFATPAAILNFGLLTFPFSSCRMAFYMPNAEPSQACSVKYQYSLNNTEWVDFSPMIEVDFGNSITNVYLRIVLAGTNSLTPTVGNTNQLLNYIWQSTGCYEAREFDLPSAESETVDVWADEIKPSGTTIVWQVSYDHGTTWNTMSELTADATELNAATGQYQRHYSYTSGSVEQDILVRCNMGTAVLYVTPVLAQIRAIAR